MARRWGGVKEGSRTRSHVGLALALLGPSLIFVILRTNDSLDAFTAM
ncbi:MAG TPA: hypothetical protein VM282_22165 [Acidimicrobiales bacterium]|nr:hypothetical protein [Acidimicrobiales bacterium]